MLHVVALGAQYWGQGRAEPVRTLTGIALKQGAAVGALIARGLELLIVLLCLLKFDKRLRLFSGGTLWRRDSGLRRDFVRV